MTKSNAVSKNATALNSDDSHEFRPQISTAVLPSVGPDDWSLDDAGQKVWQQTCAIPIGRGKSGKSTISRLLVECAKMAGRPLRFSDVDPTNIGLKDTHMDALGPGDAHPVTLYDYTRAEMEKHAERGRRILEGSTSDVVRLAAEIAESHHERWDGAGYPRGLKGKAIPLTGRIVAVADVFDALVTERPYKTAWPLDQARSFVAEQAGLHFDPRCVDAFLAGWDEVEETWNGAQRSCGTYHALGPE